MQSQQQSVFSEDAPQTAEPETPRANTGGNSGKEKVPSDKTKLGAEPRKQEQR